jgi:hypothetical protein
MILTPGGASRIFPLLEAVADLERGGAGRRCSMIARASRWLVRRKVATGGELPRDLDRGLGITPGPRHLGDGRGSGPMADGRPASSTLRMQQI